MPYIKIQDRIDLDANIDALLKVLKANKSPGKVNYVISRIVSGSVDLESAPSYKSINEAIGIMECAKLELYRRASLYEVSKIKENGDINEYFRFDGMMDT